jgi:uncharacterized protein
MNWEKQFANKISKIASADDPSHDMLHFQRVVKIAKEICKREGGNFEIVVPAAWLHDFVIVSKDSPLRHHASLMASEKAIEFLRLIDYPEKFHCEIAHAIHAHSFSANIETKTLEAKIIQDADRLDALGAIGIARCFATAGLLKRAFYNLDDPFCKTRAPDDSKFTIDHFFKKLFKISETLKTKAGIEEGQKRIEVMKVYLSSFQLEIEEFL